MIVKCCDCGKTYDFETNIYAPTQLPDGNFLEKLKCPHCGLEHQIIWVKVRQKK